MPGSTSSSIPNLANFLQTFAPKHSKCQRAHFMYKKYIFTIIFTLFTSKALAAAPVEQLNQSLINVNVENPLINEVVSLKAIVNHHFNLEAPQDCGKDATINKSARTIKCQFHSSGDREVTVSVCDNAKKYCKQQQVNISVQPTTSGTSKMEQGPASETALMNEKSKKVLMQAFKELNVQSAYPLIKSKGLGLVYVSTDWCPPCNIVKEFLFSTDEFKALTKDIPLIYVDGDGPLMSEWRERLHSFFYPSFVLVNASLEPTSILVGDHKFFKFKEWFEKSKAYGQDSIQNVKQRIDERQSGNFVRVLLDLLYGNETNDKKRWVEYLQSTAKFDQLESYLGQWNDSQFYFENMEVQYENVWFGSKSAEMSDEEKEKIKNEITQAALNGKLPDNLYQRDFFPWQIEEQCSKEALENEKPLVSKTRCEELISRLDSDLKQRQKETQNKLLKNEVPLFAAEQAARKVTVLKLQGKENSVVSEQYSLCLKEWDAAEKTSPLKEKSRAVRIHKINCMGESQTDQKLTVIESLVKDYPYDSTFHRFMASHYLKQKDFLKALKSNEKAIQYSYGDRWAVNVASRVEILMAAQKNQEALVFLREKLPEIRLEKDNKKMWVMNKIRGQLKALEEMEQKKAL